MQLLVSSQNANEHGYLEPFWHKDYFVNVDVNIFMPPPARFERNQKSRKPTKSVFHAAMSIDKILLPCGHKSVYSFEDFQSWNDYDTILYLLQSDCLGIS